jgi:hypothetical protein
VDFVGRLVLTSRQITATGAKAEFRDYELISQQLESRLKKVTASQATQTAAVDEKLAQIIVSCKNVNQEILDALQSLKAKDGDSMITTFYLTLKSEWRKESIDALQRRVTLFDGEIMKYITQQQLNSITSILETITAEDRSLHIARDRKDSLLSHLESESRHSSSERAVMAALAGNGDGAATRDDLVNLINRIPTYSAEQKLLRQVTFTLINDRRKAIIDAHPDTLLWVLGTGLDTQASVSSFHQGSPQRTVYSGYPVNWASENQLS